MTRNFVCGFRLHYTLMRNKIQFNTMSHDFFWKMYISWITKLCSIYRLDLVILSSLYSLLTLQHDLEHWAQVFDWLDSYSCWLIWTTAPVFLCQNPYVRNIYHDSTDLRKLPISSWENAANAKPVSKWSYRYQAFDLPYPPDFLHSLHIPEKGQHSSSDTISS